MSEKKNKSDLVYVNLDRPRYLRYGYKALKKLQALTDIDISTMDMSKFQMEDLEKVLYCGLLSDSKENGETLKLEDMEDLLDQADSFKDLMEKMNESFVKSFGEVEKVESKGKEKN